MKNFLVLTVLGLALSPIGFATAAYAQLAGLDKATLIEGLSKKGMNDLLLHLVETQPSADPVIDKLVAIANYRILYSEQATAGKPEQAAALQRLIDTYQSLIADHRDHEQRPIWQTDLAELLLFEYLQVVHDNASEFYDFGVPTAQQRLAYESTVAQALELTSDADLRFYQLQTDLPREPDHITKRVNTGLWDRMIGTYYKTKTPYLLGCAAYYTSLLDNDHPYYQNLNNPQIARQKRDPDQERTRLLALAIDKLRPAVDSANTNRTAQCLLARAYMHDYSRLDKALDTCDAILATDTQDVVDLYANLTRARALDRYDQYADALKLLDELADHPIVAEHLLYRLLVVDQTHRIMLAHAKTWPQSRRAAAIVKAYDPYTQLLADRTLGDQVQPIKFYIYKRWQASLGANADLTDQPPVVAVAIGEIARIDGQNLMVEADRLESDGQAEKSTQLRDQAQPRLQRAIAINTVVLNQHNLSSTVQAGAMFNLAYAMYFKAMGQIDQQLEAAQTWTELAHQLGSEPLAEESIGLAIMILRNLHLISPHPPGVADAYKRAAKVLFNQFPTSPAADDERLYFALQELVPAGQYIQAVQMLTRVPKDHRDYFEAQRGIIENLKKRYDQLQDPTDKQAAGRRLAKAANDLIGEAAARASEVDPSLQPSLRNAVGWARLALIDLSVSQGNPDQAIAGLESLSAQYSDNADISRAALSRGIVVMAQLGRFDDVFDKANKMMQAYPDDAAPVIDSVLTDLDRQIDALSRQMDQATLQQEKQQLQDQITRLAQSSEMLARLLLQWAIKQGYDDEQLLPFKLILCKAIRLAGKTDGALELLRPLLEQFPNDPDVIDHIAETLFATGGQASFIESATYFDKLIEGLPAPYPAMWWHAWMRRLQIMEQLEQSVEDIPLCVRSLEMTDQNLGGEPYLSEMRRLENKYAQ